MTISAQWVMSPAELCVPAMLYAGMGFGIGSNGIFLIRAHFRSMNMVLAPVTLALFRPYIICHTRGSNSQPHYDNSHYQLLHSLSYATPLV